MSWTWAAAGRRLAVAPALALAILCCITSTAWAADPPSPNGHDISHPQCSMQLPVGSAFGIVGINNGLPFSTNPCFQTQYRWASGKASAAVYVNTSNPAPASAFYWPVSGRSDPAHCVDSKSTTDPGCAYDYGWHAAAYALTTGRRLGAAVLRSTWWLDVETGNTWNGNGVANTAVLQGMLDYLRDHGVARVGLYSTGYQWQKITGGYTASTAASYRTAWSPGVTPDYPLHSVPLWVAGGGSSDAAPAKCSTSFTGGPTEMVQFVGTDGFDTNVRCPLR
jgi:hypothetical protein